MSLITRLDICWRCLKNAWDFTDGLQVQSGDKLVITYSFELI